MNDIIRVNHASLEAAADSLRTAVSQSISTIDDLAQKLKPLENWEGTAKDAYVQAKATWDQAIQHLNEIGQQTHVAVSDANTNYQDVDKKAAGYFDGMSIG